MHWRLRFSCPKVNSYVEVLKTNLGNRYTIVKAAKGGTTMLKTSRCYSQNATSCSYWDTTEWQMALKSKPNIVTIMLGTNDAKTFNFNGVGQNNGLFFSVDYFDMIRTLRTLPTSPKIFIVIPPPVYSPYPFEINSKNLNQIIPNLLHKIASAADIEVIDVRAQFTKSKLAGTGLTCDGCHPSHEGNMIIAEVMAHAIKNYTSNTNRGNVVGGK